MESSLDHSVIEAFRSAIGTHGVDTDAGTTRRLNSSTLSAPNRLAAQLRPRTLAELQRILAVARDHGTPLHTVSTGRNWGYGSRLPFSDEAILVSLAAFDRIDGYDEVSGTVVIEPGVTFGALAAFLSEHGGRFAPPRTGSVPESSIIGNILERGIGKGLYEDMFGHLVAFEVVTADGGHRRVGRFHGPCLPDAGPDLRGLFVQSNLAIVVRARLRLELDPPVRQMISGLVDGHSGLAGFIEASRPALQVADPWIKLEIVSAARAVTQGTGLVHPGGWLVVATVWGRGTADLAARARVVINLLERANAAVTVGDPDTGPSPKPDYNGLRGAYFGKGGEMPDTPDPDRDRCGIIWVTANLRYHGLEVARCVEAFEAIMATFGFAPALSLRALDGRSLRLVAGLFGDRDEPEADGRGLACARRLHDLLTRNDIPAGRHGVADRIDDRGNTGAALAGAVKAVLDPGAILSPGRYVRPASRPPLNAAGRSLFARVDFGADAPDATLDHLAEDMAASIATLIAGTPPALASDATAVLAEYARGRPSFIALFYRPVWSFLARLRLPDDQAEALAPLRRLHALSLFIHLWDDHLIDGQLPLNAGRLHLRSRAWAAMEAEAAGLAARGGIDDRLWRGAADTYLEATQAPGLVLSLDDCLALARHETALGTIAPALMGALLGAGTDDLAAIIERFCLAWRIVDDIQDVERDAAGGRRTAVRLALPDAGAEAWDRCAATGRDRPDAESWDRLAPHLTAALPDLIARANAELAVAGSIAGRRGWSGLRDDLARAHIPCPAVM